MAQRRSHEAARFTKLSPTLLLWYSAAMARAAEEGGVLASLAKAKEEATAVKEEGEEGSSPKGSRGRGRGGRGGRGAAAAAAVANSNKGGEEGDGAIAAANGAKPQAAKTLAASIGVAAPSINWPLLSLWAAQMDERRGGGAYDAAHANGNTNAAASSPAATVLFIATSPSPTAEAVKEEETTVPSGDVTAEVTFASADSSFGASVTAPFNAVIARNVLSHTPDDAVCAAVGALFDALPLSSSDDKKKAPLSADAEPSSSATALIVIEPDAEDTSHYLLKAGVAEAWAGASEEGDTVAAANTVAAPHQRGGGVVVGGASEVCLRFAEMLKRESGLFRCGNMTAMAGGGGGGAHAYVGVFPHLRTRARTAALLAAGGYTIRGQFVFKKSLTNSSAFIVTRNSSSTGGAQ